MEPLAIVFGVNVLSSVLKRWVAPKFGKIGVQITVFVLAFIAAYIFLYGNYEQLLNSTLAIFSVAVAFYEVILSRIPIFKGE